MPQLPAGFIPDNSQPESQTAPSTPPPATTTPPASTPFLKQVKEGIGDILPSTHLKDYWQGPAYLARHPVEGMELLTNAFIQAQGGLWNASNESYDKFNQAYKSGNYGEAMSHLLDSYRQAAEYFVPGLGPALESGVQHAKSGETVRGIIDMLGFAGEALIPTGKGKPGIPKVTPDLTGITPTLTEAADMKSLGQLSPQMAKMSGAKEIAAPFLRNRQAEVGAEASRTGASISPTPAPDIPDAIESAARRQRQIIAQQEATSTGRLATVPSEQAESHAYQAIRNNEEAARRVESGTWNQLEHDATEQGVNVNIEPLGRLVKPLAELQKGARDVILQSLPSDVAGMLVRAASRGGADNPMLEQIAHNLGYPSTDAMVRAQPEVAARMAGEVGVAADEVPFSVVKKARTGIGNALKQEREALKRTGQGREAVSYLSRIYATLSNAMRDSLPPDLRDRWNDARALSREANTTYTQPKLIRSIVYGEPETLEGLYKDLFKPGMKSNERFQVVRALERSPQALDDFRNGFADYVLGQAETERGAKGAQVGPRYDFDKALALTDERRVPGLRRLMGEQRYDQLRADLRRLKKASTDPDTAKYAAFLDRISGQTNPEAAVRDIVNNPGHAENAARLAAAEPGLSENIAAGIYWKAVDDATATGRNGLFIDSDKLVRELRAAHPAIERFVGAHRAAAVTKLADKLDSLHLPTAAGEGSGAGHGFLPIAQGYAVVRTVIDALTGNVHGAIYNGAFALAPATFMALDLSPWAIRVVKRAAHASLGPVGQGARIATKANVLSPGERHHTPEAPPAAGIPPRARMFQVRSPQGETRSMWLTEQEAAQANAEGYQATPQPQ